MTKSHYFTANNRLPILVNIEVTVPDDPFQITWMRCYIDPHYGHLKHSMGEVFNKNKKLNQIASFWEEDPDPS